MADVSSPGEATAPRTDLRRHFTFVLLGNAVPVGIGLYTGLDYLDVLILLYAESLVAVICNVIRVRLHRRRSRKRGHFAVHETDDGGLRAEALTYKAGWGAPIFWFGLYGLAVWAIVAQHGYHPPAELPQYLLLTVVIPVVELLLHLPGIGAREFRWARRHARDSGGRYLAFTGVLVIALIPMGMIAMGLAKALVEFGWTSIFLVIADRRRHFPGLTYHPGIQQEWRAALASLVEREKRQEEVLDPATWQRLDREARGDYSHVAAAAMRGSGDGRSRATFASDREDGERVEEPAADPAAGAAARDTRVFGGRSEGERAELAVDGALVGHAEKGSWSPAYKGSVDGREFAASLPGPWNRMTWSLKLDGQVVATARREKLLGALKTGSYRVFVDDAVYFWGARKARSSGWQLWRLPDEIEVGKLTIAPEEAFREHLEVPAHFDAPLALFLLVLRQEVRFIARRSHRSGAR